MCTLSVCPLPSDRQRPCAPTWTLWGPPCRPPCVWRTSPRRWLNVTTSPRWRSGKFGCKFKNGPTSWLPLSVVSDHPPLVLQVQTRANAFKQTEQAKKDKNVRKHRQERWNVAGGRLTAACWQICCSLGWGDLEGFWCLCAQLDSCARHFLHAVTATAENEPVVFPFYRSSKELLLQPVLISRNEKEKVLIEGSINSVRVSIAVKQVRKQASVSWINDSIQKYLPASVLNGCVVMHEV